MRLQIIFFLILTIFLLSTLSFACANNNDCPKGQQCLFSNIQGIKGKICQVPLPPNCQMDSQCKKTETCSGGFCIAKPPCKQDVDCANNMVCDVKNKVCIVPPQIGCPQPPGGACKVTADCKDPNLVCVSGSCQSTDSTAIKFAKQTNASPFEVVKSWQFISIMAIIISAIFVAIAYSMGIAFEMPEMKAWATTESVQIISTAIIIAALVGTMFLVDSTVSWMIKGTGVNVACKPGDPCLVNVADAYLAGYVDTAANAAKSVLQNNLDAGAQANRRFGLNCLTIYCAQLGVSTTFAGQYVLDQDMYTILFEYYGNLMSSMESQKFFLDNISVNAGPVILALGIAARSFFVTRKLGGLLIAIAVGIMFFLPGMYLFNWVTLDTTLNGDKGIDSGTASLCPAECSTNPPLAVIDLGNGNYQPLSTVPQVYTSFSAQDAQVAKQIIDGTLPEHLGTNCTDNNLNIKSCSSPFDTNYCPLECRQLPYPSSPTCANTSTANDKGLSVQQACAQIPDYCKVKRIIDINLPPFDKNQYNKCPASCKVIPPLQGNCANVNASGDCLASRFDCRVFQYDAKGNLAFSPNPPSQISTSAACNAAQACPASLDASKSCVYVIPKTGACDDLCGNCPQHCRVSNAGGKNGDLPQDCAQYPSCSSCPDSCMADANTITPPPDQNCTVNGGPICPAVNRIIAYPDNLQQNKDPKDPCSLVNCDPIYRAEIPKYTCQSCIFTEESYAYNPPINTQCTDLCGPPNNAPLKNPSEYLNIGAEGLVGKYEIQGVAKLMVPAYLLPLFDIVVTLAFIKGLSGILGGDIDIPGLSKVF